MNQEKRKPRSFPPSIAQKQQNDLMSRKRASSGGGWFLLDIAFNLLLVGIFLFLVILMSSWLIVGPWRLLGYVIKSFKNSRINQ